MKKIILIIFVFSTFIACKKDPKPGSVSLKMNHQVRSEAFVMNQKLYSSNSGHDYEITKLWYYLSEISLIDATGNKHTTAKGFLVKAEDEQSFTMQLDALPAGEYTQLKFQFGFEKEKNIINHEMSSIKF